MAWKLYYYEEVIQDIKEAKDWYRKRQLHLNRRFADDVKDTISKLQKNPLHYEPRYRNVRVAYCDIFPYAVHFYMVESLKRIVIVAIVHHHRDPKYPANR